MRKLDKPGAGLPWPSAAGSALTVILLAVAFATTAVAQVLPPTCWANSGVPARVRAEGLAELMGEIILNCYGEIPPTMSLTVALNTNVTNNRNFSHGSDVTDAVVVVEPYCWPGPCQSSQHYGKLLADNKIGWESVPLVTPQGTTTQVAIRIANIRAKAFGLGAPGLILPQIQATVSASANGTPISLPSDPLIIGVALPGLSASLQPGTLEQFRIRLLEGFDTAFKRLGVPLPPGWIDPGQEDGLLTPGSGVNDGGATQGTRFMIRFLNAPRGARVLLPYVLQSGWPGSLFELRRILNPDPSGANGCYYGGCLEPPPAGPLGEADGSGADRFAVYEVTGAPSYAVDQIEIPVAICQGKADNGCHVLAATPTMKDMKVRVSFAPVSTVVTSDGVAPRPRFVETGIPMDVVRFPF